MTGFKFMQLLDDAVIRRLRKQAKDRGITIQQLIRAVIIPEWELMKEGNAAKIAHRDYCRNYKRKYTARKRAANGPAKG